MNVITSAVQAVGLFLVTNIDDIIVLSLFFARGAGQPRTTSKIVAGQYLGFGGILLASLAVTFGAGLFLPDGAIPYFGLIPLALGGYAAWRVWSNGDDNIGVYVPVFLAVGTGAIVAYCVVFLCLVLVLVLVAKFVATRKPIAGVLERWEHVLFPLVLIVLGLVILIEGGAFGL